MLGLDTSPQPVSVSCRWVRVRIPPDGRGTDGGYGLVTGPRYVGVNAAPSRAARGTRRRRVLAAWFVVVFVGGVLPGPDRGPPPRDPFGLARLDRWLHAVAGAGVACSLAAVRRPRTARGAGVVLLATAGYSVALELLQRLLPWRTAEAGDVVAALLGASVGVCAWRVGSLVRAARNRAV